jgi:hypothetical protein
MMAQDQSHCQASTGDLMCSASDNQGLFSWRCSRCYRCVPRHRDETRLFFCRTTAIAYRSSSAGKSDRYCGLSLLLALPGLFASGSTSRVCQRAHDAAAHYVCCIRRRTRVAFPHLACHCKQTIHASTQFCLSNKTCLASESMFAKSLVGLAYDGTQQARKGSVTLDSQSGRGSVFQRSVAGPHAHSRLFSCILQGASALS